MISAFWEYYIYEFALAGRGSSSSSPLFSELRMLLMIRFVMVPPRPLPPLPLIAGLLYRRFSCYLLSLLFLSRALPHPDPESEVKNHILAPLICRDEVCVDRALCLSEDRITQMSVVDMGSWESLHLFPPPV
jgi:hypothetical protein